MPRALMIQQVGNSSQNRDIDVRLLDEVDGTFAHRSHRRAHIGFFTQQNHRRRRAVRAQQAQQIETRHPGKRDFGDQAARHSTVIREIAFRAVEVVDLGIEWTEQ